MTRKYKIDRDTRTLLLKYIRKYEEYRKWYEHEKNAILYPSPANKDGMPRGGYISDPTLSAAEKLEELEKSHKATVVKAIDKARETLCDDIMDKELREKTIGAIWKSCIDAEAYNFEALAEIVPYERRKFYYLKNEFLGRIKYLIGI